MTLALLYGLAFIALLAIEIVYIRLARKCLLNAVCHRQTAGDPAVVTGAGIVFYIAIVIWYIAMLLMYGHQGSPAYFMAGLSLVTVCSFADDMKPMKVLTRLLIQFAALALLAVQFGIFSCSVTVWLLFLLGTTWFINAYNFMDGINGMTAAYSVSVLGLLLYLDIFQMEFMPPSLIVMALLSLVVFAIFNYRKRALVFAGDAGSVSMGVIVAYVLICYIIAAQSLTPLVYVSVYATDTTLTLLRRIAEHENIFNPHHKHVYQQLEDVWKCGPLNIANGYALLQLCISIGYLQMQDMASRVIYCLTVTAFLTAVYISLTVASGKKRRQVMAGTIS